MTADPTPSQPASDKSAEPATLIGWRLLALFYDFWPVLAVWMLVSVMFTVGYTFSGHGTRENIAPFSALQIALWLVCWLVAGLYATVSWRRGGQTLGMRPWRLRLIARDGGVPSWGSLWRRYAVGTLSLVLGGLGFWWAWFDRDRLTWHDHASSTHLIRVPKR